MTKLHLLIATSLALLLAAFVFGGGRFYRASPPQRSGYSTDLNDLRTKFNADKGKVRLLMLLSPT
ncbi:MAG: hypothetical protein AABN95_15140 [Acidobacteriota bacterium]